MIIAGTGHRPEDILAHYTESEIRSRIHNKIVAASQPITMVITGMASGYDLWLADVAIDLDLAVWTVRPWAGHTARVADRALYAKIESAAIRHSITNDSLSYPGPKAYDVRNHFMVDNANVILACWIGKRSGGTWNCITYAKGRKPIANILPYYEIG